MSLAIVWFRRDLRLVDNPALAAALRDHRAVLPVYVYAPDEDAPWKPGAASRWWLDRSLRALDAALRRRGSRLYIVRGPSGAALEALLRKTHAAAVYWNRLYEPAAIARDTAVKGSLRALGADARSFNAALLFEPWEIESGQGGPYRVFTAFWRKARTMLEPRPPIAVPQHIPSPNIDALPPEALGLAPRIHWDAGLDASWTPGEDGAAAALHAFDDVLEDYAVQRDVSAVPGTSRLSPFLHFGEISPHAIVWHLYGDASTRRRAAAEPFLRELGWREFSYHLLYNFPASAEHNFNSRFDAFDWAPHDAGAVTYWQRGRTGIPIVDAGMRELWTTGWMHNRVRMLVASFLTKNLRQHWLTGARWFWDTLVDADLANNTQGWQWTAGTGADAAPYFRVFNPVTQAERFDPDGAYVRHWVPELADVDAASIHRPWTRPGLVESLDYPAPIVDLSATRNAALAAHARLRDGRSPV